MSPLPSDSQGLPREREGEGQTRYIRQRADLRRAVVRGPALVEQEGLGEQCAEDAARELGEDVEGHSTPRELPSKAEGQRDAQPFKARTLDTRSPKEIVAPEDVAVRSPTERLTMRGRASCYAAPATASPFTSSVQTLKLVRVFTPRPATA